MRLSGPAAGHDLLKTAADPAGARSLGTLNNCAAGQTPWGTYLTCEENWNGYFSARRKPQRRRAALRHAPQGWGYRWHEFDERFDAAKHPNEPNRFGWVVEIDPHGPDPDAGQAHRAGPLQARRRDHARSASDGRAVVYMGDDERFEYIYKFVSRDRVRPGGYAGQPRSAGPRHAVRRRVSMPQGHGRWLPLVHGQERPDRGQRALPARPRC